MCKYLYLVNTNRKVENKVYKKYIHEVSRVEPNVWVEAEVMTRNTSLNRKMW